MGYITVVRKEVNEIGATRGWVILYGRRKTGKTFLLRNFLEYDAYLFIRRDGSIRSEGIDIREPRQLVENVGKLLTVNKTVVIDEFQRLPENVLEDLTKFHPHGKLVLSGSSLRIVKKIFEPGSPLLGFFTPIKMSLIDPVDILRSLCKLYEPAVAIELAAYLRDPWLIPLYGGEDISRFLYKYTCKYWHTVRALIGEIFTEEERTLTRTYEAILRLIGAGIWKPNEIANILYTRGIIKEPGATSISGYLKNMIDMDLLNAIRIFHSKRKMYRLKSPIMEMFYYLESRYDVTERNVGFAEVKPTIERLIRIAVERYISDLLATITGGRAEYLLEPEVDIIITSRNIPKIIAEVKWGRYSRKDIIKFLQKTQHLPGKKIFVTKKKDTARENAEILDAADLVKLATNQSTIENFGF